MIAVTFSLQNPYFKSWRDFKNISNWHGRLPWKNKYWEFEVMRTGALIEFDFTVRTRCDHAGVALCMSLFYHTVKLTAYDNRHWDNENETWSTHE